MRKGEGGKEGKREGERDRGIEGEYRALITKKAYILSSFHNNYSS